MKPILAILHDDAASAAEQTLAAMLARQYSAAPDIADVLVVVGGNSRMLRALHEWSGSSKRLFGLSATEAAFLTNPRRSGPLHTRIARSRAAVVAPLVASIDRGSDERIVAFNEIAVSRASHRMIVIDVLIGGVHQIRLRGDGVLLATPFGSTAYNRSAGGPVIPLQAKVLALTPIALADPLRWRGALLPFNRRVTFRVDMHAGGPAQVTADHLAGRPIREVTVSTDERRAVTLLFDPELDLNERQLLAQFSSEAEPALWFKHQLIEHRRSPNR